MSSNVRNFHKCLKMSTNVQNRSKTAKYLGQGFLGILSSFAQALFLNLPAGDFLAPLAWVVVSVSVVVHVFVVAPHEVLSAFPHVEDIVVLAAFWTAWHGRNRAIF